MAWTLLLFLAEADTLAQYVESVTFTTHISAFTIMHYTETIQRMGATKPPDSQNHQQGLCLPHAPPAGGTICQHTRIVYCWQPESKEFLIHELDVDLEAR